MAKVIGSGFQLPPAPSTTGVTPAPMPTVRVTVGGVVAPVVLVVSSTELRVQLPRHAAGACDLFVENIDQSGVQIPGEYQTLRDAVTYRRPDLSAKGERTTLSRVTRAVLALFRDTVIPNVNLTVHTDFDSLPMEGANIVEVASLPAIIVTGPKAVEDRFYSTNESEQRVGPDGVVTRSPPLFVASPTYTVTLLSDSTEELITLISLATSTIDLNSELQIPFDPEDPSRGNASYEFDFSGPGGFETTSQPNESNIRQATATIVVRGVAIEPIAEELAGATGRVSAGVTQYKPLADRTVPPGEIDPVEQGGTPYPDISFGVVQYPP